jgi:hypothetical protein
LIDGEIIGEYEVLPLGQCVYIVLVEALIAYAYRLRILLVTFRAFELEKNPLKARLSEWIFDVFIKNCLVMFMIGLRDSPSALSHERPKWKMYTKASGNVTKTRPRSLGHPPR